VTDGRISWFRGKLQHGVPRQIIGVLELRADDCCRGIFAGRAEIDGRRHIRLARSSKGTCGVVTL
jgi:hypothetical protein